jgi:hypothetical protein
VEVGSIIATVVIGLVGILAWLRAGKAAKKANEVAEELVGQSKRIADVQERLEERQRLAGDEGRVRAIKALTAKLTVFNKWIGELPESPKEGAWNDHPVADVDLTPLEGLVIDAGLDDSVLNQISALVSAVRRLNTGIQEARDRELGRVPGTRGYSSVEIQQWRRDRSEVGRTVVTLLALLPGEGPTPGSDQT